MSIIDYICPICGNTDIHSIGYLNGKPYCRKCISFRGEEAKQKPSYPKIAPIHLDYELSLEQKELSDSLLENYKNGVNTLVNAICGSGKTEIVLKTMQYALNQGQKVGFAIPRRDVVIEISNRLRNIFLNKKIITVYGGHHDILDGDIICLTTHQLFRYKNFFDLLILDEIDAFPYKDNDVLNSMFFSSVKGFFIQMTATASEKVLNYYKKEKHQILHLDVRYHQHLLPVPEVFLYRTMFKYVELVAIIKRNVKQKKFVFLFCPTISECEKIFKIIKNFVKEVNYVHSKRIGRAKIIEDFRNEKYRVLVTTAVLERGVTIKNLNVVIFNADHSLYDKSTLIQISGRAGRKIGAAYGRVFFICSKETNEIRNCIKEIQRSNLVLQDMLQKNQGI